MSNSNRGAPNGGGAFLALCGERYFEHEKPVVLAINECIGMFEDFRDVQRLEIYNGPELLKEAKLSFRFLGKGMELQVLRAGIRELSVVSNSAPFVHALRNAGDVEITLGFGSITRGRQSLRVGLGGALQSLSADESLNSAVLPSVVIPTVAIFIERPFSPEKVIIGLQFMEAIPMREISIDIQNPQDFDRRAFKSFCHRHLNIPESPEL
jgi:hypothetical protein